MSKLKLLLACCLCKLARRILRLLRRGGTSVPGRIALKICPDITHRLSRGTEVVLVTGTNGKTTTCQMLRRMAEEQGKDYISNLAGANMADGIAAVFACGTDALGRMRKNLAIIECDEGAVPAMAKAIQPRVIVVTNLFRDQLDRYGELTLTRRKIKSGIENAPGAAVCLNADCSLTATIAEEIPNARLFFGVDAELGSLSAAVSDAPRCLACGRAYEYSRRSFAHLGDWYCPGCGRRRPEPDVNVENALLSPGGAFLHVKLPGADLPVAVRLSLPAAYNVYNAAAALTAASAMDWDVCAAVEALSSVEAPFGRMERFELSSVKVQLMLAKNPAGMDRILEYLASVGPDAVFVFCLNDNYADGTDVSWIWDADFESFCPGCGGAAVYGLRRGDMLLRLKYAGMEPERIEVCSGMAELKTLIAGSASPVYIAANYTSMLEIREALAAMSGKGHF